jgi:hypothetical protein
VFQEHGILPPDGLRRGEKYKGDGCLINGIDQVNVKRKQSELSVTGRGKAAGLRMEVMPGE